jgi:hypothetical protein
MNAERFDVRVVVVAPGHERAYDEAEWEDALVLLESGELELEGIGGSRCHFESGAVLSLVGLRLRALRNHGREPALVVAISRHR